MIFKEGINATFNSAQSTNADSVYWDFGDGTSSTQFNPNHNYLANGLYNTTLYVYNQCGIDSSSHSILISGIGIYESLLSKSLNIYPNPNEGNFRVEFDALGLKQTNIEVFDLRGRIIYEDDLGHISGRQEYDIELNNPSNGVYLVKITMDDDVQTRRVIIE